MARFRSTAEYLASLKPTAPPLNRMTRQARRAVEKSMIGMPSDEIEGRVREAVRDVAFLSYLYLKLNQRIELGLRVARPTMAWLYSDFRRILLYRQLSDASRDFPYPVDPQTAAAVDAALANQVQSWDSLGDARTIVHWPYEVNQPDKVGDEDFDASRARAYRKVKRALRRLSVPKNSSPASYLSRRCRSPSSATRHSSKAAGSTPPSSNCPSSTSSVNDRGWTPRGSGDSHPLAFAEFVRADAEGDLSPIDDAGLA